MHFWPLTRGEAGLLVDERRRFVLAWDGLNSATAGVGFASRLARLRGTALPPGPSPSARASPVHCYRLVMVGTPTSQVKSTFHRVYI